MPTRLTIATVKFGASVRESPSALVASSEGAERFYNLAKEFSITPREHLEACRQVNKFVYERTIPDDLRTGGRTVTKNALAR